MVMENERRLVVEYGIHLSKSGLCPGTSGNLSILNRELGLMAISPSGMDYLSVTPSDITVAGLDANVVDGKRLPSSEWALHTKFYKAKPDICAVVHTHSIYCTTFAVLGLPLRPVHFMIADAGVPEVPCAPYALFGTEELADIAVKACGDSSAVLLKNHGIVCCGGNVDAAFSLARNMEYVARLQYQACAIGTPEYISKPDMLNVMERLSRYGQPKENGSKA